MALSSIAASTPGRIEIVDWAPRLLKKGHLLEARFAATALDGGAGSSVYYEYVEDGRKNWISTVGSLSAVSFVLLPADEK